MLVPRKVGLGIFESLILAEFLEHCVQWQFQIFQLFVKRITVEQT